MARGGNRIELNRCCRSGTGGPPSNSRYHAHVKKAQDVLTGVLFLSTHPRPHPYSFLGKRSWTKPACGLYSPLWQQHSVAWPKRVGGIHQVTLVIITLQLNNFKMLPTDKLETRASKPGCSWIRGSFTVPAAIRLSSAISWTSSTSIRALRSGWSLLLHRNSIGTTNQQVYVLKQPISYKFW